MIINAGIRRVYYLDGYADPLSAEMLRTAAVDLVPLQPPPASPEE
jgi:deoxycytidylate deaminase